ncbi:unnamed protein product [Didymodactylos carnosus]|uniref:DED domain-containing protein n=1 Tax=Didymodactylos carnosus TaxID=1234261 RepID=A0A814MT63_9BILA|nr:unnamed protein product [Didymodactylos carnosus]CAF1082523.1 unnamed protein product [Didymodactylos carnosus]CAF3660504.1 unnamed protein product [Didymodactylos carnosus]CAF3848265.1 unnamed protein product [Didymodactylos carnosus]
MEQNKALRALLVKVNDHLSDYDRRRLHFLLTDIIPRRLRDDPTIGGTLDLLESLFDRAMISGQDFNYLITAFKEIECYDAEQRLREHQQLLQQSQTLIPSTSSIMEELCKDNTTDKLCTNSKKANEKWKLFTPVGM